MKTASQQQRETLHDALVRALRDSAEHNRSDTAPPAAVLWPDRERRWQAVVPRLRDTLTLLTLGKVEAAARTSRLI